MKEEKEKRKVFWLDNAEMGKEYTNVVWYRCVGGENFIKEIEESGERIVGIDFHDNNVGFIIDNN
jgi:hypothetical protein